MRLKKLFFLLLISVVMVLPAAGCGGGIDYEAIELVPEGAELVAGVKVSEAVRNWELYSELEENEETSGQYEEARDKVLDETGIDLSDVSGVVMFADISDTENMEYVGIIVTGNFGDADMVDKIEEKSEMDFTTETYCGYTLYIDRNDEGAFVEMSKKMIILGSVDAVKDCVDVAAGKADSVSGVVMDTYDSLGDVVVRLAIVLPEEFRESFAEEPEDAMMPVAMEAFADIQTLGMAVDMGTQSMTVKVNADFSNSESAADAAESLETMIDFVGMMSQEQETAELFDRIEISVGGSRMYLTYDISLAELAEIGESFKDGMGIPFGPPDMDFPDFSDDIPETPEIPDPSD